MNESNIVEAFTSEVRVQRDATGINRVYISLADSTLAEITFWAEVKWPPNTFVFLQEII